MSAAVAMPVAANRSSVATCLRTGSVSVKGDAA